MMNRRLDVQADAIELNLMQMIVIIIFRVLPEEWPATGRLARGKRLVFAI